MSNAMENFQQFSNPSDLLLMLYSDYLYCLNMLAKKGFLVQNRMRGKGRLQQIVSTPLLVKEKTRLWIEKDHLPVWTNTVPPNFSSFFSENRSENFQVMGPGYL